jgi:hypothetical protein
MEPPDLYLQLPAWPQQFDLRNGSLRKKFDSLKYTLKKMEVLPRHFCPPKWPLLLGLSECCSSSHSNSDRRLLLAPSPLLVLTCCLPPYQQNTLYELSLTGPGSVKKSLADDEAELHVSAADNVEVKMFTFCLLFSLHWAAVVFSRLSSLSFGCCSNIHLAGRERPLALRRA